MAEEMTPEELLWEAAHKALLTPRGRVALVLRLSELPAPAPRRYHRRIAHLILQEAAARHDGTLFLLRGGDAVLLCRLPAGAPLPEAALTHPEALPQTLARLFRADMPNGAALTTAWRLEHDDEAMLAYAARMRAGAKSRTAPCSSR